MRRRRLFSKKHRGSDASDSLEMTYETTSGQRGEMGDAWGSGCDDFVNVIERAESRWIFQFAGCYLCDAVSV